MARRQNKRRKDGLIAVQVYLGMGEDHKRRYKTVYGATQKEADAKAEQIKLSLKKGLDLSAEKDTFGEWSARWLRLKRTEVSIKRYNSYKCCVDKYDALKDIPISKLRPSDFQTIILDVANCNPTTNKPAAKYTLTSIKNTAKQIMQLAVDNRVIDYNPVLSVKIPDTHKSPTRRALTAAEQSWIVDTPHRAQTAAMIMMYAGLRRGEVIPLTWSDIDINNRTITVCKSVEMINDKPCVKSYTKTEAGMRTVDIPKKLADYLASRPRNGLLVCSSAKGHMLTETAWKRMWESYIKDLNIKYGNFDDFVDRPKSKCIPGGVPIVIPHFTAHWLRHTFATILYLAGVDVLTAKEQLGHSDIKTTLDIYTHLDSEYKRRSMSKLDDYLSASKSG